MEVEERSHRFELRRKLLLRYNVKFCEIITNPSRCQPIEGTASILCFCKCVPFYPWWACFQPRASHGTVFSWEYLDTVLHLHRSVLLVSCRRAEAVEKVLFLPFEGKRSADISEANSLWERYREDTCLPCCKLDSWCLYRVSFEHSVNMTGLDVKTTTVGKTTEWKP